jgi:hypothetical protein
MAVSVSGATLLVFLSLALNGTRSDTPYAGQEFDVSFTYDDIYEDVSREKFLNAVLATLEEEEGSQNQTIFAFNSEKQLVLSVSSVMQPEVSLVFGFPDSFWSEQRKIPVDLFGNDLQVTKRALGPGQECVLRGSSDSLVKCVDKILGIALGDKTPFETVKCQIQKY